MAKTYTVNVICSWCQGKMGTKAGFGTPEPTHGCCTACEAKYFLTPPPGEHKSFSLQNEAAYGASPGGGDPDWWYYETAEQWV